MGRGRAIMPERRVAVGLGPGDRLGDEITGSACPALDDELLPETLRQPLTHQAGHQVNDAAGREASDDTHRPRRVGLRVGDPQYGKERGGTRCEQKLTAPKLHGASPGSRWPTTRLQPAPM